MARSARMELTSLQRMRRDCDERSWNRRTTKIPSKLHLVLRFFLPLHRSNWNMFGVWCRSRSICRLLHCQMGTWRSSLLGVIPNSEWHWVATSTARLHIRIFVRCALQNCFNFLINFCWKYETHRMVQLGNIFGASECCAGSKHLHLHHHKAQVIFPFRATIYSANTTDYRQHNARDERILSTENDLNATRYMYRFEDFILK